MLSHEYCPCVIAVASQEFDGETVVAVTIIESLFPSSSLTTTETGRPSSHCRADDNDNDAFGSSFAIVIRHRAAFIASS